MKKLFYLLLIIFNLMSVLCFAQESESPQIINHTRQAEPGSIIQIFGDNLTDDNNECDVLIYAYAADEKANYQKAIKIDDIISKKNDLLQVRIPPEMEKTVYAVWIMHSGGISEPMHINKAESFWVSENKIYSGQRVRIFGRNFINENGSVKVKLKNIYTLAEHEAEVVAADEYTVDILIPQGLQPGYPYVFGVSNGLCPDSEFLYTDSKERVTYINTDENLIKNHNEFGVEAAWIKSVPNANRFNVEDYGAKGDGKTDDTNAIALALNAAEQSGGGIVQLGEGTFKFSSIQVPANTILCGVSKDKTILLYDGSRRPSDSNNSLIGSFLRIINATADCIGICNLSLNSYYERPENDTRRRVFGWQAMIQFGPDKKAERTGYFLKNVDIYNADGTGVYIAAKVGDVTIDDCNILQTHSGVLVEADDVYDSGRMKIRNNLIYNNERPLLNIPTIRRLWLEGNSLEGLNCEQDYEPVLGEITGDSTNEHRYADLGDRYNYVAKNDVSGQFGSIPPFNDGEGFLTQGQERVAYSTVTGCTKNTISDSTKSFTNNSLVGYTIAIVHGKGAGQFRLITYNNRDTFYVDKNWDVMPDETSYYTIDKYCAYKNIFFENDIKAYTRGHGIKLFCKNYDNIIDKNVVSNTAGISVGGGQNISGNRADYSYFAYINGNDLSGGSFSWSGDTPACMIGTEAHYRTNNDYSTPFLQTLGNEYKNNKFFGVGKDVTPTNPGDSRTVLTSGIYISGTDEGDKIRTKGVVVENNKVSNTIAGIHLGKSSADTVINGNDFSGNGTEIQDSGSTDTIDAQGVFYGRYPTYNVKDVTMLVYPEITLCERNGISARIHFDEYEGKYDEATGYIITAYPGNITAYSQSGPVEITGLDENTDYIFDIRAVFGDKKSIPSGDVKSLGYGKISDIDIKNSFAGDKYLYICENEAVKVCNIENGLINKIASISVSGTVTDVEEHNDKIYICNSSNVVDIYTINENGEAVKDGQINTEFEVEKIAVCDSGAYMISKNSVLSLYSFDTQSFSQTDVFDKIIDIGSCNGNIFMIYQCGNSEKAYKICRFEENGISIEKDYIFYTLAAVDKMEINNGLCYIGADNEIIILDVSGDLIQDMSRNNIEFSVINILGYDGKIFAQGENGQNFEFSSEPNTISEIWFESDGERLDKITLSDISCNVMLRSFSEAKENVLISATYQNEGVLDVTTSKLLSEGEKVYLSNDLSLSSLDNTKTKLFLWKNMKNIVPLTSKEITLLGNE